MIQLTVSTVYINIPGGDGAFSGPAGSFQTRVIGVALLGTEQTSLGTGSDTCKGDAFRARRRGFSQSAQSQVAQTGATLAVITHEVPAAVAPAIGNEIPVTA